jgi:hypothetical protein
MKYRDISNEIKIQRRHEREMTNILWWVYLAGISVFCQRENLRFAGEDRQIVPTQALLQVVQLLTFGAVAVEPRR